MTYSERLTTRLQMIPAKLLKPEAMDSASAAAALTGDWGCQDAMRELAIDYIFNDALEARMQEIAKRKYASDGWAEFLYCVIRVTKPEIVLETGVFEGHSSARILRAMERNGTGRLISIDLPATSKSVAEHSTDRMGKDNLLPPGLGPGWVIPESLRSRHELILGDSKLVLPGALERCGSIDIFIHDSLHTDKHMTWEYNAAWPYIRSGGMLLSDDIFWNAAFYRFSRSVKLPYVNGLGKFGAIRKP